MITHQFACGPSLAIQTVRSSGRGYVSLLTISHDQPTAQTVTFYLGDGLTRLAAYTVAPGQSPYTLAFPRGFQLWFEHGLKVMTGTCTVNMTVVW